MVQDALRCFNSSHPHSLESRHWSITDKKKSIVNRIVEAITHGCVYYTLASYPGSAPSAIMHI